MVFVTLTRGLLAAASLVVAASSGRAQSVADFYKGKTIDLDIGYSVGGAYDLYARHARAAHRQAYSRQSDGAAEELRGRGQPAAGELALQRRRQGRHGVRHHRPRHRLRSAARQQGAQFDATKFTWIGSANNEVSICVAWTGSGITKFEDMLTKELIVGGTSTSADTDQFPRITNGVLGTKMKIVTGYPGGNEVGLAMERGEVQGRCGWSWSSVKSTHQKWIDDKKFTILVQLALEKHADLPDVPLIIDLAKTDEQRQILRLIFARQVMGRPFVGPPGIPPERAKALRDAFMATMTDKEFIADTDKAQMEVNPVSGDRVQALVKEIYATPPEIAKKAASYLR